MSAPQDGGPAFPGTTGPRSIADIRAVRDELGLGFDPARKLLSHHGGMSLRDYFAAKAMQGLLAASGDYTPVPTSAARQAYAMADAMLAARASGAAGEG